MFQHLNRNDVHDKLGVQSIFEMLHIIS